MNEADVVSWAQSHGSDAKDARDAAHEGWHGHSLGVEVWGREQIHSAIMKLRLGERARQEVCARAAEWLACEKLGIDYKMEDWASISIFEAVRSGISMPFAVWIEGITNARTSAEVVNYVEQIFDAVAELA